MTTGRITTGRITTGRAKASRAALLVVSVASLVLLPGCAVSLFSEAKRNPETDARLKHMELRMDRVDAEIALRAETR